MAKALAAFGLILICAFTSNAVSPSKFFVVIFGLFLYDFAPILLSHSHCQGMQYTAYTGDYRPVCVV